MAQERISIEIVADDRGLQATLKRAGVLLREMVASTDDLDSGLKRTQGGLGKFGHGLRGIVLDLNLARHAVMGFQFAVLDLVNPIIKSGAAFEKINALMEGMSSSTDKTILALEKQANTAFLVQKAMSNPFGIDALRDSMVKLKSAGFDPTANSLSNFNSDLMKLQKEGKYVVTDLSLNMQNLLDAVANFGGTSEQLKRASVAIQQMAGKGVISMEELRQQLGEAVPNAVQLMADSLEMTYQDLVKKISEGKIKAEPALLMMFREMEIRMGGSASRMMKTWDGMVAQLSTSWEVFKKNIYDTGFGDALKKQVEQLTTWLASPAGIQAAQNFGLVLAGLINTLASLARFISNNIDLIVLLSKAFIAMKVGSAISSMIGSMSSLGTMISAAVFRFGLFRAALMAGQGPMAGFAVATRGLGFAISGLLGPIGLVVGALATFGASWLIEKKAIDENTRSILENMYSRKYTTQDLKTLTQQRIDASTELGKALLEEKELKEQIADIEETGSMHPLRGRLAGKKDDLLAVEERIAKIKEQRDTLSKAITLAEKDISETAGRERFAQFERRLSEFESQTSRESNAFLDAKQKEKEALLARGQDISKIETEMRNARSRHYDLMLGEVKVAEDTLANEIKKQGSRKLSVEQFVYSELLRQKREYLEGQKKLNKIDSVESLGSKNTGAGKEDPLVARYNALQKKLAGMTAEITAWQSGQTNLNKELAITEALMKIQVQDAEKVTAEMVRDVSRQVDALKDKHSFLSKALANYDEEVLVAQQATEELHAALAYGDAWTKMSQRSRELALQLLKVGEFGAEAKKLLEELFTKNREADSIKELNGDLEDLRKSIKEWTNDSLSEAKRREKSYVDDITKILEMEEAFKRAGEYGDEAQSAINQGIHARTAAYMRENRGVIKEWVDDFKGATESIKEAFTDWMDDASSAFADFIVTGKNGWADFRDGILRDIANIVMKKAIVGLIDSALSTFGGQTPPSVPAAYGENMSPAQIPSAIKDATIDAGFAMGGVMTSGGSIPLRKYSNGGVAKKPQLALFGEGRTPEAYVPLPDGRTIPVSIKDGMKQSGSNVTFNLINQSGIPVDADQGPVRFDGEKMIMDVVLKNVQKPGKFRDGLKTGVRG
jgi:lambda family phage tail tape measure protein